MAEPREPVLDDRCPFEVAMAVVRTIAALDPSRPDEDSVVRAVIEAEGPASAGYLEAIARSRHSLFYPQLLRLYEYGRSRVPEAEREGFCFRCGRTFTADLFRETLHPVLQVALARRGDFPAAVEAMVRTYLERYTGGRYRLEARRDGGTMLFRVRWSDPEAARRYLEPVGLDPGRCMRDSAGFIAGAVDAFAERIFEGYTVDRFSWSASAEGGEFGFDLGTDGRFAYDALLQGLIGHIRDIEAARDRSREADRLEGDLVAGSPVMRQTWELVRRASRSDEIVLLRGESGTGKSVMARKIHELSRRSGGPFVEVALTSEVGSDNMVQSDLFGHERGAFTGASEQKQGLFSLADGGTLFLDEIGDATPELQAKLLRVLESSTFKRLGGVRDIRVDVRVIAATNRDLEGLVREGKFREDLYYRITVIPVLLPPLRERAADLPALADFLLARARGRNSGRALHLAPGVAGRLAAHAWPGNVRELDHALKYAAAMAEGEAIGIEDFPGPLRAALRGGAPAAPAAPAPSGRVVDAEALRRALRSGAPPAGGRGAVHADDPRHIDHAKRIWLETLLDEFGGDLALAARYWDRSSEKTLRALVKAYGLGEALAAARARGPRRAP